MELGDRITYFRQKASMTQKELAAKMGISAPRLNTWERGKRNPPVGMINEMCRILQCDANMMIGQQPMPEEEVLPQKQPEPKGYVTVDDIAEFLVSCGVIKSRSKLSDTDRTFLEYILGAIVAYFEQRGQKRKSAAKPDVEGE